MLARDVLCRGLVWGLLRAIGVPVLRTPSPSRSGCATRAKVVGNSLMENHLKTSAPSQSPLAASRSRPKPFPPLPHHPSPFRRF